MPATTNRLSWYVQGHPFLDNSNSNHWLKRGFTDGGLLIQSPEDTLTHQDGGLMASEGRSFRLSRTAKVSIGVVLILAVMGYCFWVMVSINRA